MTEIERKVDTSAFRIKGLEFTLEARLVVALLRRMGVTEVLSITQEELNSAVGLGLQPNSDGTFNVKIESDH